ncbi:MAG TPA: hypothetical protein VGP91_04870 [Actinoplanes sp.]|jgi:hypothetical protein|nr:hypothetical protein [Actinoplanes sp.]
MNALTNHATPTAVSANSLRKAYGGKVVLDGVGHGGEISVADGLDCLSDGPERVPVGPRSHRHEAATARHDGACRVRGGHGAARRDATGVATVRSVSART